MYLKIFGVIVIIGWLGLRKLWTYSKLTGLPSYRILFNKGYLGEYRIYKEITSLRGYYKILGNIHLGQGRSTSEIDLILIHEKGVFVIESKNFKGRIRPRDGVYWSQDFDRTSYSFYSPILQNKGHIRALNSYLKLGPEYYWSLVVFSNKAEILDYPKLESRTGLLNLKYLRGYLKREIQKSNISLTRSEVDKAYYNLKNSNQKSRSFKRRHIKTIKKKY